MIAEVIEAYEAKRWPDGKVRVARVELVLSSAEDVQPVLPQQEA